MSFAEKFTTSEVINAFLQEGLVVVKKADLENLMLRINAKSRVDNRNKYLSHKEVIDKYGVTDYWLRSRQPSINPDSLLVVDYGKHHNSKRRYQEQSVIDELARNAIN